MKITWIGHSCFRIEKEGDVLIIDPYGDGSVPGLKNVRENADKVICTHEHGDHSFRDGVTLSGRKLTHLTIKEYPSYHDEAKGSKRGLNKIFVISDGKARAAHAGDLGAKPDCIDELKDLDVLMIPVGGFYTIDGREAAEIAAYLQPRIIIPMHYRNEDVGFGFDEISTVDAFLSAFSEVMRSEGCSIDTDNVYMGNVMVLKPLNA